MAVKKAEPQAAESQNLIAELYTGSSEKTFFRSPMVPDSFRPPYNPDKIWQKTGNYETYEEMLLDDQVSVCSALKKDLILGSGFTIVSGDEGQEEIVEDIETALNEDCDIPFMESLQEILSGNDFGFSLTEKTFKLKESKLRLKYLKTRHPNSWLIYQDNKGNIEKYVQNTVDGFKDIEEKSLIHFVNNRKFQNPYGTSDLRAAYKAWFAKNQVVKYYAMYLENATGAKPVAKYDKNAPADAVLKIYNTIKNLQAKTAMVIPKEIEVEFLEAKTNGEAYSKAINIFNMFIGRSLFIPDLLGLSGSETTGGSFSLGKEQINIFFMHILRRRAQLEKLINYHIIQPLVQYNFGNIEKYPKIKFNPLDDGQAVELAKTWLEAVKSKVYKPTEEEINYFRSLVKFPEGDVEFIEPQPVINPLDPNAMDKMNPGKKVQKEKEMEDQKDEKKSFKIFDFPSGDYHKKVNFKAIETKLNDYDHSISNQVQPIIKKIFADLYDQIERKKIVSGQNVNRIDTIKLKYLKELKQVLKGSFMELYKDAQSQASSELFKANFRTPITSEQFLEVLEKETFQYVGDWEYTISKKVRAELIAAIKDGKSLSVVLDLLDDDGKALAMSSIERFARTKHTEVLNKGRVAFFEDSGVVSGYQYSAVLDDKTSEICRGLHGKKFKAGDEPIPPMHFNCRSVLIPITKFEEFEPSETVGKRPIDEFIDDNVGEGFAVK